MRLARLRRLLGLALIGAVHGALELPPAAAQSRIEVPDGCGSEAEFQREIQRLTGTPAPPDLPSSLVIEALGGGREGYELRLVVADERRVLRDPECRILWRSALVIVAAASRGEPAPGEPPVPAPERGAMPAPAASPLPSSAVPAPVPSSAAPPPPAARPPAAVAPAPVTGERARATAPRTRPFVASRQRARRPRPTSRSGGRAVTEPRGPSVATRAPSRSPQPDRAADPAAGVPRLGADVGLGVSSGVVPELGAALDVGARLEVLPWGLAVSLRYWPQRTARREGRAVDVWALGGRVAGLFRVAPAWTLLVGLEVNRLLGEGADGVSGPSSAPAWQLAPTAGLSIITWNNEHLRVEVGAAGRASLVRPEFVVTGFGDLYRVPVLGADAIIRGAWLFR